MGALIAVASAVEGTDYLREGLTLEALGLAGVPRRELDRLLAEGCPD